MRTIPAAILLAGAGCAALLADRIAAAAAIAVLLLAVCLRARGPRRLYLYGALTPALGVFLVWPLFAVEGANALWSGPVVPVLGMLDVTVEELELAGLYSLRFAAVSLAFAAYALLLDHDDLVGAFAFARRSSLAVALATRLVPTLERDAAGLTEAIRGRGVAVEGLRGHARLLSPLVAGSLERASSLAEAMEARGFGRPGATRAPRPAWGGLDRAAVALSPLLVAVGALWL
ncbi:MAG: energy-coupling factor transporter transmembrane component T [Gaiellaceae bacterium]